MRQSIVLWVALVACKGKPEAPPAAVVPPPPATAIKKPAKPPPTAEQRAAYKKHVKAGWSAQKDQRWADAVPEFEAALKAIDGDPRALSELGFSAMNAGDFAKARKADLEAVRVAFDPKVKAASLFNLGIVQEKSGDKDGALKSYLESLKLRANKTVAEAIAKLGATPQTEPPLCKPKQDPCECVMAAAFGEFDKDYAPTCEPVDDPKIPVKTFHEYFVKQEPWSWTYLLDEHQQLAAIVGGGVDRTRVTEEITLEKAELRTIQKHKVLWIQTKDERSENHPLGEGDAMDEHTSTNIAVTICVVGDDKTPTHCPLRDIPLSSDESIDRDYFTDEARAKDKSYKPEHTETVVDVTLGDDGTVTVKLVKGASDPALDKIMGPHKLW